MSVKKIMSNLRIQDEALKISRDFMVQIPDLLLRLAAEDPAKAITAWVNVTEFAVAKKGKDEPPPRNMNLNINMVPAKRRSTLDIDFIEVKPEKLKDQNE